MFMGQFLVTSIRTTNEFRLLVRNALESHATGKTSGATTTVFSMCVSISQCMCKSIYLYIPERKNRQGLLFPWEMGITRVTKVVGKCLWQITDPWIPVFGLWVTWSSGWYPGQWQGVGTRWSLKVPSKPNYSMIVCFRMVSFSLEPCWEVSITSFHLFNSMI